MAGDGRRVLRGTATETTAYASPHYELRFTKTNKPEDLDDDCLVTVIDIMQVAAQWGQAGGPEDLDGSGTVDVGDVQQVAGQWRETCHVLAETVKYYALGDRPIAMRRNNTLYYLFGDHLGSTSVSYRSDGGDTITQRYYPWGTIRPGPANTLPTDRTFTGQQLDADTGLMYYSDGAGYGRYYEPLLGRFSQPDTLVPNPGDPQQFNRFTYARNNPLRYRDSTGHWLETAWDIANILWDIHEVRRDPSLLNIGALVVDVGATVLPFVPAGVGMVARGGKAAKAAAHADELADAAKVLSRADKAADAASAARRLAQVGAHSDEGAKLIKALAKQSTKGELAEGAIASLGHFKAVGDAPGYIEWAKKTGAVYLDMDEAVYGMLEASDTFWDVNQQFLDDAIEAGAQFHLQIPEALRADSHFAQEINYLRKRGYQLVQEGGEWWLKRP